MYIPVYVYIYECVCSFNYPAYKAHAPYCHLWPVHKLFPHYVTKGTIFGKKVFVQKSVF